MGGKKNRFDKVSYGEIKNFLETNGSILFKRTN